MKKNLKWLLPFALPLLLVAGAFLYWFKRVRKTGAPQNAAAAVMATGDVMPEAAPFQPNKGHQISPEELASIASRGVFAGKGPPTSPGSKVDGLIDAGRSLLALGGAAASAFGA